jgi:hypothetical protein
MGGFSLGSGWNRRRLDSRALLNIVLAHAGIHSTFAQWQPATTKGTGGMAPRLREGDVVVMRNTYFPQYETPYRNLKKWKNAVRIHALIGVMVNCQQKIVP